MKDNHVDTTWYGAKYNDVPRRCAATVITTAIRAEIKIIRKVDKKVAVRPGCRCAIRSAARPPR